MRWACSQIRVMVVELRKENHHIYFFLYASIIKSIQKYLHIDLNIKGIKPIKSSYIYKNRRIKPIK
jgi:hypothetical protein